MPSVTNFSNVVLTDLLIHGKMDDGSETIMFPITRYDNIMGSPKIVSDLSTFSGAPFFFYSTDTVEINDDELTAIIGISSIADDETPGTEGIGE